MNLFPSLLNPADGGYRELPDPPWLLQLLGRAQPTTSVAVVAVALTAGLMLRLDSAALAPLLALQAYLALIKINPQIEAVTI